MFDDGAYYKAVGGSERNFGLVFSSIFALIGLWPLIGGEPVRIWALALSVGLVVIAWLLPKLLTIPNRVWTNFGLLLGAIIAPIVMLIVFIVTVTPIGLFMRARGADILRLKLDPEAKSYWIQRTDEMGSLKNQF